MTETLPRWVAEEIRDARWEFIGLWKYSGYILDMYLNERRMDVQFYDRLPEGRYIAALDVPDSYALEGLNAGGAYIFEFKVYKAELSETLTAFLQERYSTTLKTIYRFELASAEELK